MNTHVKTIQSSLGELIATSAIYKRNLFDNNINSSLEKGVTSIHNILDRQAPELLDQILADLNVYSALNLDTIYNNSESFFWDVFHSIADQLSIWEASFRNNSDLDNLYKKISHFNNLSIEAKETLEAIQIHSDIYITDSENRLFKIIPMDTVNGGFYICDFHGHRQEIGKNSQTGVWIKGPQLLSLTPFEFDISEVGELIEKHYDSRS